MRGTKRRGEEEKRRQVVICLGRSAIFVLAFACFAGQISAQNLDNFARSIQTGTSEQKRDALFQIRNLRSEIASRIAIPALSDPDLIVRATAASSVIFLPKAEAVSALAPLLNDKAEFVRTEAAYALGTVGSSDSAAPLLRLLEREKTYQVRTAAVTALGSTGEASAAAFLLSILKQKPMDDEDFLRRSAARSIGQIAQIIRTGNENLVTPKNFLPEKFKDSSPTGTENLAAQFPVFTQAVLVLSSVLRDKNETDDTRRESAFALGAIGDASAVAVLESNIHNPDYYLAEICKEALLKIKRTE